MVEKDFFRGFMKIHILYHASKREVFGSEFLHDLRLHGYSISPGTLYPTLHSLERKGCLTKRARTSGGRVRKYYSITPSGKKMLKKAKEKVREIVEEVLDDKPKI